MAISIVQVKASGACSGAGSATLTAPTTAGNAILVFISEFYSLINYGLTMLCSDGTNGSYSAAFAHDNGGGAYSPSMYVRYFENAAAVSVINCNDGGGQYDFSVVEVAGLALTSSLDQAGGYHKDSATSAYAAAGIMTTQADEIIFGLHLGDGTSSGFVATPSGSFSTTVLNFNQVPILQVQAQIVAATGTYTSAGTWNTTLTTDSAMVSFKGAGGGPPPGPTYPQLERGIRGLARGVAGGIARSFVRKDRIFVPAYATYDLKAAA